MANVKWGKIPSDKRVNKTVATHKDVGATTRRNARRIAGVASSKLSAHRKTGKHAIEVTQGKIDVHVSLVGPGAIGLELGHHDLRTGKWVEGIHVLRGNL